MGALVGLLTGIGMGCTSGTSSPFQTEDEPQVSSATYRATGSNASVEATLFGNASRPLAFLAITVENTKQEPIVLDLAQVSLFPEGGIKSLAEATGIQILAPGASFSDTLPIQSIHQARVYQEYGWVGSPTWRYSLPLSFISNATAGVWESSLDLNTIGPKPQVAGVQLYQLAPDKPWLEDQMDHWQGLLIQREGQLKQELEAKGEEVRIPFDAESTPFVHASLPELSCGGINVRLTSYQRGDSLYVGMRMVNHSPFTVSLPLERLACEWNMVSSVPAVVYYPKGLKGSTTGEYLLKKGQRVEATLVYALPTGCEGFVLRLDQVHLQEVNAKAFHDGLAFDRMIPQSADELPL
ncbi:MAG TPA: hypothetical protein DCP28_35240 [Cytophagales bacterium]|nr:hypothetical protein [Cytophagales bacterium]